jgi:hypothetical protein
VLSGMCGWWSVGVLGLGCGWCLLGVRIGGAAVRVWGGRRARSSRRGCAWLGCVIAWCATIVANSLRVLLNPEGGRSRLDAAPGSAAHAGRRAGKCRANGQPKS